MKNIIYKPCKSQEHLQQILELQKINLAENIDSKTFKTQGFVTAKHDFELLAKMNQKQAHVIALDTDKVIGYALSMTCDFSNHLDVLKPMFNKIENLTYRQTILKDSRHFIMGQVCVDKNYRSTGVFGGLYEKMHDLYSSRYDYLITEIDDLNKRSMAAHAKVGFETIHSYQTDCGKNWNLVLWDWN